VFKLGFKKTYFVAVASDLLLQRLNLGFIQASQISLMRLLVHKLLLGFLYSGG